MNSKTIKFLLALCLLLLFVLLIEWQIAGLPEDQLVNTFTMDEESNNQEQNLSEIPLSKQPLISYSDMVDRPLFIKGRKNISDKIVETTSKDAGKIEDLTLIGIYTKDEQPVALFSQQGVEKKFIKISANDEISGWMVNEIQPDKVILDKIGRQKTLLLRAPKDKIPRKLNPMAPKRKKPKSRDTE